MKPGTEAKLKFKQLKRRMKLPHWQIIGVLETLWRITEHNAPAGNVGKLTDEEIAAAYEWDGDASELVAALIECRFLDVDEHYRLIVHNWSKHCPNHLKGALAKNNIPLADVHAEQLARQRAKQDTGQAAKQDAKHPPTSPSLSVPNHSVPNHSGSCSETAKPSSPPNGDGLLTFPCDGEPGQWSLTQQQISQWSDLFPSLDVLAECRAALAWILCESSRHKTAKGMARFLVGWLGRSQNRGGSARNGSQPKPRQRIRLSDDNG